MIIKEHPVSGYGVSTCGKVFNKKGVPLQGTIIHSGYHQVYANVSPPSGLVHRAVYETFVGAIPDGLCINHKDGNKLNNNLSNLECVTYSENSNHAYANNLSVGIKGEDRHDSVLTDDNVFANVQPIQTWVQQRPSWGYLLYPPSVCISDQAW